MYNFGDASIYKYSIFHIVPANMEDVLYRGTREENQRVVEAMLKMKKLNIAELERARKDG